jgi:hypothetical protein
VAVTLVLAVGTVLVLRLVQRPEEPVAEAPPTPIPRPTPSPRPTIAAPTIHPALEEADALLMDGDVEAARTVVGSIPPEAVDAFSDEETELYTGIVDALQGSRLDGAISDLEGGLRHGSIRMLKRAVAGLARFDPRDYSDRPQVGRMLSQAHAALELHTKMWQAHDDGDQATVLDLATAMIEQLPEYSTPHTFREEAAAALESDAAAAAAAGDFDRAEALLSTVRAHWEDREGLAERLTEVAEARTRMRTQLDLIDTALARGWDGHPADGLQLLDTVTPMPVLTQRFDKASATLREQLAKADARPPRLELAPGVEQSFKKKRDILIELVITDDHGVVRATAFFKPADATSYSEIPLRQGSSADRWRLEIGPDLHANDDFFVYFEARDVSGHTGRLGEPGSPLEFTRKKGLKAIFGK